MKQCKIEGCIGKYYAKGYCRSHYRILSDNESKKRWLKIKEDKGLYIKLKKSQNKWRDKVKDEEWFKEGNRRRQKKHYYTNLNRKKYLGEWKKKQPLKKKRLWYLRDRNKKYYNGLRELVIKRDGEKCVLCGMKRKEHIEKYGMDLAVNHINHKGRTVERSEKDNRLENLQTLCFSCHPKLDKK